MQPITEQTQRTPSMSQPTENSHVITIKVDDQNCELNASDIGTFQELIRKIELELVPKGRVLTHIFLNGEFLTSEQEELFSEFGVKDITSLEVKTAEPIELALTSLSDTLDYLPELAGSFEKAAKFIRRGDYHAGLALLDESLDLVQTFNMLLDGVRKVLMIDFFQIKLESDEGDNIAILNQRLGELANEILESAKKENWTELADLLEYELSPLLYRYLGAMPYVIEAINERNKKPN
jgi:hypothetical protein